jgi:Reverse transcriptase (RNA-dependent DNA polymerase)
MKNISSGNRWARKYNTYAWIMLVKPENLNDGCKVHTNDCYEMLTWKTHKANGTKQEEIYARGYEQVDGEHYNSSCLASPVVSEAPLFVMLIKICMAKMGTDLNDVKGEFLNGKCSKGEQLYMEVPEAFEMFYPRNVVLLLLKSIYGLKQSAYEYWLELLKAVKAMKL